MQDLNPDLYLLLYDVELLPFPLANKDPERQE
jgi:hypothetical protein